MSYTVCKPLVTIAIPTQNSADKYLINAISSAAAQTYENLEIIVADNCSTDNTSQVIKNYNDERLQYIRHDKNLGPNGNFNFCLQSICWVLFVSLEFSLGVQCVRFRSVL